MLSDALLIHCTLVASVLLIACRSTNDSCSDPVANQCEAVDPGVRGPFDVGVVTWELTDLTWIEDGAPRALRVDIWYPSIDEGGAAAEIDLVAEAPAEFAPQFSGLEARFIQDAVRDATPDFEGAPTQWFSSHTAMAGCDSRTSG